MTNPCVLICNKDVNGIHLIELLLGIGKAQVSGAWHILSAQWTIGSH